MRRLIRCCDDRLNPPYAPASEAPLHPEPIQEASLPRGRGRPKLGVQAREVTLLPRHWDWLAAQPGGASVTLRKLIEQARRAGAQQDRQRQARERAYRFMSAACGNLPGFEAACRSLFAGDGFATSVGAWPTDLGAYCLQLAQADEHEDEQGAKP